MRQNRAVLELLFIASFCLAELLPYTAAAFFGATWPVLAAGLGSFMLGAFAVAVRSAECKRREGGLSI